MKVRVVGIAVMLAIAAIGAPLGAERAGASSSSEASCGGGSFHAAETMMRRQPAPVSPRAKPLMRRLRAGTLSLGGQVGYGVVRGSSQLNDHFDRGVGYALRFRYMLSKRTALGFSFENQHYGVRAGLPPTLTPFATDSQLVVTTVASEAVLFFHRERETTPYLLAGLGFASPNVTYGIKESARVDEGPFLVLGAGLERFIRPRFSLDFSLRGYGEVGNSELTLFSQLTAGIHLYPGD